MSNIAKIMPASMVDGEGVRVSVYISGCSFRCPGCYNASIWDFNKGIPCSDVLIQEIMTLLDHDYIQGLSILGGEPLQNIELTRLLVRAVRENFGHRKDIWLWSGYMIEWILHSPYAQLLDEIDVLIDGPFVQSLYRHHLKFRGSLNQRIHYLTKKGAPFE
ncbi:anaerobic ribonucleoside-triphosphate reductase activating protein [Macrococcoides canis]|uniref:Anaerobic ribonucleoside-triphosphate reductase-activating protein n=1 Tax=Macrococcoides canis TaxID=1855823 RepID=A0AAE6X490_9STAP|nr:anaerobic ribonucleoside-triphosphate reductase activating protein [Macrococcus canis]QIH79297.1 anaerobic ribonucleoside-triphosphate reductase activating protein [Macrococcus canis]